MRIGVTGGAGFIGSHLVERLLSEDHKVKVIDNLSSGKKSNIPEKADLAEIDIKNKEKTIEAIEDLDIVFHFAANPVVSTFPDDKEKDFNENLAGTKNVLDACEQNNIEELVFASSSVVYGEEAKIPTPETADIDPISMYGATKAGAEHMCRVYSQIFGFDLTILRYANIVGGRNQKGVIRDFLHKLKENSEELEILGNGLQKKSYLHIEDTINATIKAWKSDKTTYNIGSQDAISVNKISAIVSEEMGLEPEYSYTGGEKGWQGDIPEMRLDISKIKSEGWKPENNSKDSVRKTAREILKSEN